MLSEPDLASSDSSSVLLRQEPKNFWCYMGEGIARDATVAGVVSRMLPLLQDTISPTTP
jgi:hypothetical protein